MRSPLPVHAGLVDELQVGLVHEGRRLERVPRPLLPQLDLGETPQPVVDRLEQGVPRALVAALRVREHGGHVGLRHDRASRCPDRVEPG